MDLSRSRNAERQMSTIVMENVDRWAGRDVIKRLKRYGSTRGVISSQLDKIKKAF